MTNFLLVTIIIILLCQSFGAANVFGTIGGLIALIIVLCVFEFAIKHIWNCLK